MSEAEPTAIGDLQAWRDVVTNAVDVLLRQAERRMNEDSKAVFASSNPGAVLILKAEQEKVRDLREQAVPCGNVVRIHPDVRDDQPECNRQRMRSICPDQPQLREVGSERVHLPPERTG